MRLLWREWRSGEWLVVFIALLLAVTAITALHFYVDRLMRGLDQQSATILGGNLVVSSATPIADTWKQKAKSLNLRTAEMWVYPSMASVNDKLQLVNLQAVSEHYPLLNHCHPERSEGSCTDQDAYPSSQTVWVEPRLLPLLSIKINDAITIGSANFVIKKLLTGELAAPNTGWMIAPRVLMRLSDVPATRTVLPGSRVDYRLLLAGDDNQIQQFRSFVTPQLQPGQRLLDIHDQQFVLRNILGRADDYLQLVLLVCLMMSGVAIALSIQQYLRRHYSHVALWRCLGAREKQITQIFVWQLMVMAFLSGVIGIALGFGMQAVLANLFVAYLHFDLPAAGIEPIALGFVISTLLLFAFAYPVVSVLPRTSPLYLWRNEIVASDSRRYVYFIGLLAMSFVLVYWMMNFSLLTLYFIDILIISVCVLYLLSLFLLKMIRDGLSHTSGTVRRGLSQLVQHPHSVGIQFVGFTLIITLLMVLGSVRTDIISRWNSSLPQTTPNYFAINIAPDEVNQLQQVFQQQHVPIEGVYPMARGRLIALNGKPIMEAVPEAARGHNALHRELNLSWMWQYPSDNKIMSGATWGEQDKGKAWVSAENSLKDDLHLRLGDQLTFQIGDQTVSAVIVNFRSVDWASFHPNFYMIFPPGLFDHFPATYITSFHLATTQTNLLNQLVQQFPNITIIDVADLLKQVQDIVGKISSAIQYLFLFALGAGILIFTTSLQASLDERQQTYYLLRVLGASKRYIHKSILVEFGCLALIIALVSFVLAKSITFLLLHYVFP